MEDSKTRKHHFNEHYFDEIDSQEKAYWLGFLYADGCVREEVKGKKYCRMTLALQPKDIEHLNKFNTAIESDYPIMTTITQLNGKEYTRKFLSVYSEIFINALVKHGCVQNKSLILKPPIINDSYAIDFIRGYFDGDGSICRKRNSINCTLSFLGTDDLLMWIAEKLDLTHYQIRKAKKYTECKELRFSKSSDVFSVYNKFYSFANPTCWLDRKYEKFTKYYIEYNQLNRDSKHKTNVQRVATLWNDGLCRQEIINKTGLCKSSVVGYLKEGFASGICDYSVDAKIKHGEKVWNTHRVSNSKVVNVYDKNNNFIKQYDSISSLIACSLTDFGKVFTYNSIKSACKKSGKIYNGFLFSYG